MPCLVVKPVPEAIEAMFNEVLRCAKVEPRIDWGLSGVLTEDRACEKGNMSAGYAMLLVVEVLRNTYIRE